MYAPILIPTLNRYEHLRRCIDSLKKNTHADETELYISLDYPPASKYVDGYQRVRTYLETELTDGFKKINIFYQTKNLGIFDNDDFLYQEAYKKYDRFIYTEDDNEFSPNFLEYVNKGLDLFEGNDDIFAICGYRDERPWVCCEANVMKLGMLHAWGFGTWKSKIERCRGWLSREHLKMLVYDNDFCKNLYQTRYKLYYILIEALFAGNNSLYADTDGKIRFMDYTAGLYMVYTGMYSVMPCISMVRNWGFDGSGVNCIETDEFKHLSSQPIDNATSFEYKIPEVFDVSDDNLRLFKEESFEKPAQKAKFYRMLICMVGLPFARKVYNASYKITSLVDRIQKSMNK